MALKAKVKKKPKSLKLKSKSRSGKVAPTDLVLKSVYELNSDALFRVSPNGRVFVILTGDMGSFFQIDGIAAQLWELFDGKTPAGKLIEKVKVAKSVSKALLVRSASKLILDLKTNNLIKKV